MAATQDVALSDELQLVVFELADESYGVEISGVQEIIVVQPITPVPRAPEFIEGVINLRGRVVPVVDLRRRFGLAIAAPTRTTRIVVVVVGEYTLGLVVDAVSQVLTVEREQIEPPSPLVATVTTDYLRGIVKLTDRLIVWLDLDRVLTAGQQGELAQTSAAPTAALVRA